MHVSFRQDEGLTLTESGKRVNLLTVALVHPLTEDELRDFCGILGDSFKQVGRVPTSVNLGQISLGSPIEPKDLSIPSVFCRYVARKDFDRYLSRGSFRFANLSFYRRTAFQNVADPLEGFTFYYIRGRGSAAVVPCYSFFNHALFCGSTDCESEHCASKFGPVRLILRDIRGFCETVAQKIRAVGYHCYAVRYSTPKIYAVDFPDKRFTEDCRFTDPRYFSMVRERGFLGSLFLKTPDYSPESECRISFEMPADIDRPIVLNDQSLLKFFEIDTG
jgi:hypothetical protein